MLASRLSEDAGRSVLLIEAGPSYLPDDYPPDLTTDSVITIEPHRTWGYQSVPGSAGHAISAYAGRVLGGGSAINAGIARRGRPSDFARWVAHGLPEWSWEAVLEAYKALENTPEGDDRWHGRSGPWPVRQSSPEELTPPVRAFVDAAAGLGLRHIDDFNGTEQAGTGSEVKNIVDGKAHLGPDQPDHDHGGRADRSHGLRRRTRWLISAERSPALEGHRRRFGGQWGNSDAR